MILVVLGPFSLACGFGTTGLSLKEKIHAEQCHCPKVFLDVLGEAMVGTGPHASLDMRFLIQRSFQKHLDCCTQLSVAGHFCESESRVPLL